MCDVTIIYATQTGCALDVALEIERHLTRYHLTSKAVAIDEYDIVCFMYNM